VGINHSAAVRCHSTPAGHSQAPRFPASQGLPLDSEATLSLTLAILKFLLQAVLDACYSAMLLNLEHYTCHCFIRRRAQCMLCSALRLCLSHRRDFQAVSHRKKNPPASKRQPKRRNTAADIQPRHLSNASHARGAFKRAIIVTLAAIRLQTLAANSADSGRGRRVEPRPRCGGAFCKYELLNRPVVVSNFSVVSLPTDRPLYMCRSPFRHAPSTSAPSRTPRGVGKE
jgi:hypothetical protein